MEPTHTSKCVAISRVAVQRAMVKAGVRDLDALAELSGYRPATLRCAFSTSLSLRLAEAVARALGVATTTILLDGGA